MADELHFSANVRDRCIRAGTGAGYQFEFFCQCCNDTWRSPFEPYRSGQVSGWLQQVQGALGALLGNAGREIGRAASGVADAGWGQGRDAAFKQSIESAQAHFHRCAKCRQAVCARCWDGDKGLCRTCAPNAAAEVEAARNRGTLDAARAQAYQSGAGQEGPVDTGVKASRQLVCPQCATESMGGNFCAQCGHRLGEPMACAACQTVIPMGGSHCPGCGKAVAAGGAGSGLSTASGAAVARGPG
jgi:hypothetical protein